MRFRLLLISCLFSILVAQAREGSELRGAIPAGLAAPLLIEGKPGEATGLIADYTIAIIETLGKKSSISTVTRNRLYTYLLNGQMDLLCYTSSVWSGPKETLSFSKTLFTKTEVILGPSPMPKKISGLKGKTIGTVLQYVYPKLDPLFGEKKIIREDGITEESNLRKLLSNRISYVITDDIFLDYFKLEHPKIELNRERLFVQNYPISCSFNPNGRVKEKELNAAIDEIKANGKLESIFRKYGATLK